MTRDLRGAQDPILQNGWPIKRNAHRKSCRPTGRTGIFAPAKLVIARTTFSFTFVIEESTNR
jgi:hypothetical protein